MEPKRFIAIRNGLLSGLALCLVLGAWPVAAIDVHAPAEVIVENGTTGILNCSFESRQVVNSAATVEWSFRRTGSDNAPSSILYFSLGTAFPGIEYKDRVQFIGDLNQMDASIQLSQAQFGDNGTYFCDVKNPPDIAGRPARTVLRVVLKEPDDQAGSSQVREGQNGTQPTASSQAPELDGGPSSVQAEPQGAPLVT